jgi:hypothetical protein
LTAEVEEWREMEEEEKRPKEERARGLMDLPSWPKMEEEPSMSRDRWVLGGRKGKEKAEGMTIEWILSRFPHELD